MARQLPPKFMGVLKNDEKLPEGWIMAVYRLPSGHLRYEAKKAVLVGKNAKTGELLMQQRLVDIEGNPV